MSVLVAPYFGLILHLSISYDQFGERADDGLLYALVMVLTGVFNMQLIGYMDSPFVRRVD